MKMTSKLLILFAAICICFSSCQKDSACAEDLLKTIPADASAVAILKMESLNEDSINNLGIEPTVMAFFAEGGYQYVTGTISDTSKFKKMVEEELNATFTTENELEVADKVAIKGSRFWYSIGHRIDATTVNNFTNLTEKQSILSIKQGEELKEVEHDISGWGSLSALLNTANLGFQERSMTLMALQTIFDDPQDIAFTADVEEEGLEAEMKILNSKGKPAKASFTTAKLNLDNINSMGGNASLLIAGEFPAKFISQLKTALDKMGPNLFSLITNALQCIDGTIACAYDSNNGNYNGVITTTGKNTAALSDLLSSEGGISVTRDGNYLRASKGVPEGEPVSELSKSLKDAMFGVVMLPQEMVSFNNDKALQNVKQFTIALSQEDGSLELKLKAISANKNENILNSMFLSELQ